MGRKEDDGLTVQPNLPDEIPEMPEFDIPKTWPSPSKKSRQAMQLASRVYHTRHGLFASVPLVCKAEKCPYADTCIAVMYGVAPFGERCPVEIANIKERFDQYCEELGIDDTKIVNVGLVKELIDCEIMIERCNQLLASEGDMIKDVVVGINEMGNAFYRPEVHKALDIKNTNLRRKSELLQLLNSTPKDKAKTENANLVDPSRYAAEILQKFMESKEEKNVEK